MNVRRAFRSTAIFVATVGVFALGAESASAQSLRIEPKIQLSAAQMARLQSIADQGGANALRAYLWRTRTIYGWSMDDLV
jgi:hypothetical protein